MNNMFISDFRRCSKYFLVIIDVSCEHDTFFAESIVSTESTGLIDCV